MPATSFCRTLSGLVAVAILIVSSPMARTAEAGNALQLIQRLQRQADSIDGLNGATSVAISSDGTGVYLASDIADTILAFTRDPGTGALSLVDVEENKTCSTGNVGISCTNDVDCGGACTLGLNRVHDVAVSPDGECVWAVSLTDDAIASFQRNPADNSLDFVARLESGTCLAGAVGSRCNDDEHCDTAPDAGDGLCLDGARDPDQIAVSPASDHVYVVGRQSNDISVFARSSASCALELIEVVRDGQGSVTRMDSPRGIGMSPFGDNVYVVSGESAIVTFSRDPTGGGLSLVQELVAGLCTAGLVGGVCSADQVCDSAEEAGDGACDVFAAGLAGPDAVVVSPDGDHVYVAGVGVPVFSRAPADGALTLLADGEIHAGFGRGQELAISGNGASLYVADRFDNVLLVHARDATTGLLELVQLAGPNDFDDVATGGGDTFVHTAERSGDAVATYRRIDTADCTGAPMIGCRTPIKSNTAVLTLVDRTVDEKDKLVWKWVKGAATAKLDFGAPPDDTSFAVCLYDQSGAGGAHQLLLASHVPPAGACVGGKLKACWKEKRKGFLRKDKSHLADGVDQLVLTAGAAGKSAIKVVGKGARLDMPSLILAPVVTAQLQSSTGTCWEALFSAPSTNAADKFKAKGD